MTFTSKERNFLRKLATDIDPVVRIGKNDITDEIFVSISNAIDKNELIKVKVLNNSTVEITSDLMNIIEEKTKAYCICKIGNNIVLFKPRYVNNNPGKVTKKFMDFRKGEK